MRRAHVLLVLALALCGCGGQAFRAGDASSGQAQGAEASADAYADDIAHKQRELARALRPSGDTQLRPDGPSLHEPSEPSEQAQPSLAPDCGAAAQLRDQICELADRICSIAAREATEDLRAKCEAARRACDEARRDVRTRCAMP